MIALLPEPGSWKEWKFRFGSISEILVSQGPGSAFQPTAEPKSAPISESRWAANGQERIYLAKKRAARVTAQNMNSY
jgi:hypothetical protein